LPPERGRSTASRSWTDHSKSAHYAGAGGTKEQQEATQKVLVTAESSVGVAEAQVAQALGYELCRAHYPPVIMTVIGFFDRLHMGRDAGHPIFECPGCGNDNAGPFGYTRTAPGQPRQYEGDAVKPTD